MKKVLLLILIGFTVVSIFTIMFTIQESSTFTNFEDDNGDNGDDHIIISHLNINHVDNIEKVFEIPKDLGYHPSFDYFRVSNLNIIH